MCYYCFVYQPSHSFNHCQDKNSVDPDQTAPYEQSDLGLYCFSRPFHQVNSVRNYEQIPYFSLSFEEVLCHRGVHIHCTKIIILSTLFCQIHTCIEYVYVDNSSLISVLINLAVVIAHSCIKAR